MSRQYLWCSLKNRWRTNQVRIRIPSSSWKRKSKRLIFSWTTEWITRDCKRLWRLHLPPKYQEWRREALKEENEISGLLHSARNKMSKKKSHRTSVLFEWGKESFNCIQSSFSLHFVPSEQKRKKRLTVIPSMCWCDLSFPFFLMCLSSCSFPFFIKRLLPASSFSYSRHCRVSASLLLHCYSFPHSQLTCKNKYLSNEACFVIFSLVVHSFSSCFLQRRKNQESKQQEITFLRMSVISCKCLADTKEKEYLSKWQAIWSKWSVCVCYGNRMTSWKESESSGNKDPSFDRSVRYWLTASALDKRFSLDYCKRPSRVKDLDKFSYKKKHKILLDEVNPVVILS